MSHILLGNQLELFKWNISTSGSFGFFHKILQQNPNKLFGQSNRFLVMLEVNGLINQYWPVGMTVFFSLTKLDSVLKSRNITLLAEVCIVKAMVFPGVMYRCESWTIKKAECQGIDAFKL